MQLNFIKPLKRVEGSHRKKFKALLADSPDKNKLSGNNLSNKENRMRNKELLNNTCELEGVQKLDSCEGLSAPSLLFIFLDSRILTKSFVC